ncbi:MAG: hypothetical protein IJ508_03510 [Oscillospiraceae bacterium]|nr:hypothetical protein [Oscillospiraceae bacterium]
MLIVQTVHSFYTPFQNKNSSGVEEIPLLYIIGIGFSIHSQNFTVFQKTGNSVETDYSKTRQRNPFRPNGKRKKQGRRCFFVGKYGTLYPVIFVLEGAEL